MEIPWLLIMTAVVLGFRHGIDWDHIAAIMDIVGTTSVGDTTGIDGNNKLPARRPLVLSSMYAFGHALVVAILGICAMCFGFLLPTWINPIMERLVGCTLILLGIWVCLSLLRYFRGKEDFHLHSRWMILLALIVKVQKWLFAKLTGQNIATSLTVREYEFRTAFGIGMIHGISAETGTQVLMIVAIGGAASHALGATMLISFLFGLLISNTLVAILGSTAFVSSKRIKHLCVVSGVLTCGFSLVIGSYFALGQGQQLPDLRELGR